MTELQKTRTRHHLPDTFTTAEFREEARRQGIENERPAIEWLIGMGQIERVKVGHYRKTDRFLGEQ